MGYLVFTRRIREPGDKRTRELFGAHADEALTILYAPKRGCRDSGLDDILARHK